MMQYKYIFNREREIFRITNSAHFSDNAAQSCSSNICHS